MDSLARGIGYVVLAVCAVVGLVFMVIGIIASNQGIPLVVRIPTPVPVSTSAYLPSSDPNCQQRGLPTSVGPNRWKLNGVTYTMSPREGTADELCANGAHAAWMRR